MNIGVFIGDIPQEEGGGFTFQESIVNSIYMNSSPNRHFVVFHYGAVKNRITTPNIKYHELKRNSFFSKAFQKLKSFRRPFLIETPLEIQCKAFDIDLVWFPSYYFENISFPFIYTIWDLQHRLQPLFPELLENNKVISRDLYLKNILLKASYVLTGTERGKSEIIGFYNVHPDRIKLLPHPTPFYVYRTSDAIIEKVNYKEPFLFYPAQFWSHKNHIVILLALKYLADTYGASFVPKVYFVGSEKNTKNYIQDKVMEFGLSEKVVFLGFVSNAQLVGLYKNATALIYSSLFGPENLPPLEAFAFGCPAIVSDVPGSTEQYQDAVLYFERFNEVDLASKIKELIENKLLRDSLITKGKVLSEFYSLHNYQLKMEEIFAEYELYLRCWKS